jgi:hypothetical protein
MLEQPYILNAQIPNDFRDGYRLVVHNPKLIIQFRYRNLCARASRVWMPAVSAKQFPIVPDDRRIVAVMEKAGDGYNRRGYYAGLSTLRIE